MSENGEGNIQTNGIIWLDKVARSNKALECPS